MSKVFVQIPYDPTVKVKRTYVRKNLVPCPCCMGPAADARDESWYHNHRLVRAVPMRGKTKGELEWECVICRNKREVTPAKAMTFILTHF